MKTDEIEELRSLDAWIAVNLFGWTIYTYTTSWKADGSPLGDKISVLDQNPRFEWPHYSTDAAAALEVLKKCAEKTSVVVYLSRGEGVWCVCEQTVDTISHFTEAPTLELAICRFARALFNQQEK